MRAYVAIVDRIYEVEGRAEDDDFFRVSQSSTYFVKGARVRPSRWAITKDAGYLALESEIKENLSLWKDKVPWLDRIGVLDDDKRILPGPFVVGMLLLACILQWFGMALEKRR